MKGWLLFSFFCMASLQAKNQNKVVNFKGLVISSISHEALSGASIYIPDIRRGTIADVKGNFMLMDVPEGNHLIEISYSGFSSYIENIVIAGETDLTFQLKPAVTENNEIVVTGIPTATSLKKIAIPVVVMRRKDLLQTSSSNIIEALTKKPGINQIGTGPAISKPVIRGLGYNRVVVINDGLRQEGQQWGDEHGIEIDEYSIQKAEILKGPASLMYGSDAIAGVVNFITSPATADGTIKGTLLSNYQTNNRQRGFFGNIAGSKKGISLNVYATLKAAGDYKNAADGYVLNSKFTEKNTGAFIGINKAWGYSHLVFSSFNQQIGLVEGERNADGRFIKYSGTALETPATDADFAATRPLIPYQRIEHTKLVSDNSFFLKGGKLTVNVGVQQNKRMEFGNPEDENEKELFFDLQTVNYNVQYHINRSKEKKISFGVGGMNQQNKNKGEEAIIPDYTLQDAGAFMFAQKKIKRLNVSGGLRFDIRTIAGREMTDSGYVKFQQFQNTYANVSASAGFVYEFKKYGLLRFNLARGFRAPNAAELSSNGAHEGTNRFEVGNRQLRSEISLQADAGVEVNTEHLSISAALFNNRINHYIYFEKTPSASGGDSIVAVDGEDFYLFRFVQQNANLYGMELSVDVHPHPLDWLHIENSFSFVRGQLAKPVQQNRNVPFIPAARLLSELRFDLFQHKKKLLQNTYWKLELDQNFAQRHAFTTYNTETVSPSYALLNAGAGTDFVRKGKTILSFYFVATNLTNVSYQNHLSRLKYAGENQQTGKQGVYNMGRNFSFKINIPLTFVWK